MFKIWRLDKQECLQDEDSASIHTENLLNGDGVDRDLLCEVSMQTVCTPTVLTTAVSVSGNRLSGCLPVFSGTLGGGWTAQLK